MERKPCPYCGEEIAANAKKCRYCGEWLEEGAKPMAASSEIKTGINHVQQITEGAKPSDFCPRGDNANTTKPKYVIEDKPKGFFETYFWDSLIKKYASFSGLASRKEFWLTQLAYLIICVGLAGLLMLFAGIGGIGGLIAGYIVYCLVVLALALPSLAICCRRLRDAGLSPWLILVSLVPGLGALALLIMYCLPPKYEHNPPKTRFSYKDGIIIGICVLMLGVGIWSISRSHYYDDYVELKQLYEIPDSLEYADEVAVVIDDNYYDRAQDAYPKAENSNSGYHVSTADESLFDIVISPESVIEGEPGLVPLRIGKNYDKVFFETGSTNIPLIGKGVISRSDISVECFLTEIGELHGRYRNHTQGVDLDLNGYIQPNGDLYIQLGHDSEKSEWRLHPVSDEVPNTYRYEGTWGKNDKWSYIVFREESDY